MSQNDIRIGPFRRTASAWALALATLLSGCSHPADAIERASDPGARRPGIVETTEILREAFVYGFPLIVNYKVLYDYFVDSESPAYRGPINQIHSDARVYTYEDTAVSTPNSDTPYSLLEADLRAEPLVLCMPQIDPKRYYSVQLVDMYTFNYGYIGSRTTGNEAGCYLLAGPAWRGDAPPGIAKVFRSETPFSLAIYRTQLFGPSDLDALKRVQAGYRVQPLSAYLGQPAPPPAPAIAWPKFEKDLFTTGFPAALDFLLQFMPPTGAAAVEKPLRAKFASVGIGPGKRFEFSELSLEHKAGVAVALDEGFKEIERAAGNLGKRVNGWQIGSAAGSRAFFDGDWLLRAVGSKIGIYGNDPAEATYPFAKHDRDGDVLDGSEHAYRLTFPKDGLPPVHAFWSITMYDAKTQLLIENPIDRYLINSPMLPSLESNADGSLTLFIQHDSPGKDHESNWLPAPKGEMFIVMRLYWPKTTPPSVLPPGDGTWQPPGIVKQP